MSILVGYDRSDASVRALERAAAEAREAHVRLIVLAVMELPLDPRDPHQFGTAGDGTPITGPFPEPPEITDTLDDARSRLEQAGVAAEYVWAPGEPARLIVDIAEEQQRLGHRRRPPPPRHARAACSAPTSRPTSSARPTAR